MIIPKMDIQRYIYIFNSYICTFDCPKLEIPKLSIIEHIYILLNLIYVYQNRQNWKIEKRKVLSVLAHENYICKLKHKKGELKNEESKNYQSSTSRFLL